MVEQAQKGSSQAVYELYQRYFYRAYYTAIKVLKDEISAEEVVQESFLRVLTKIESLREPENFEGWFFSIVYREIQAIIRARKKTAPVDSAEVIDQQDPALISALNTEFLPEEALASKEDRTLLMSLIDGLPMAQRAAVVLFYFNELSIPQIATVLGISTAVTSKRLFDARTSLKNGFASSALSAKEPLRPTPGAPVIARLMRDEFVPVNIDEVKERTDAWLAAMLPTVISSGVAGTTGTALAARAQAFMGSQHSTSVHTASWLQRAITGLKSLPILGKVGVGVATCALVTGGAVGAYALVTSLVAPPPTPAPRVQLKSTPTPTPLPSQVASPTPLPTGQESGEATTAPTPTPAPAPAPTPTPAPKPAQTPPTPAPKPVPAPAPPTITVAHTTLIYPVGARLTISQILSDAGAWATDAQGHYLTVTVGGIDVLDCDREGSSLLYLHAVDSAGVRAKTKVITVQIE